MVENIRYSNKDFTVKTFSTRPASEFNDSTIKNSSFSQNVAPAKDVFPGSVRNLIFDQCNLDNCVIPLGATALPNCQNRVFAVQTDGEDWEVDGLGNPLTPLDIKYHSQQGFDPNPVNLPAEMERETTIRRVDYDVVTDLEWNARTLDGTTLAPGDIHFWFKEKPPVLETTVVREELEVRSWNGSDQFFFDTLPVQTNTRQRRWVNLSTGEVEVVTTKVLVGQVTMYRVRGAVWKYRGE